MRIIRKTIEDKGVIIIKLTYISMVHLYLECCAWFQSPPHKNNEVNLNNNREGWQGALEVKEQLL